MAATSYSTDPTLYLFTSLTAGSSHIITATSRLETILKANKIPFRAVDCATDEKARMLWGRRSKGRTLPGLVRYGEIIGDLEQIEEWNEYGELKDQIAATQDLGGLKATSASLLPEPPTASTAASTPQRSSGPPSRASSETRHISIFDPKDKERDKEGGAAESTSHKPTDAPITLAMRQLGAEAAAKAGHKKAAAAQAAKAAVAPTKEPSTTDQIPVPATIKSSADAAVESPETAPNVTAAKTPAQLASEGAKRTSVDKISESEGETASPVIAESSSSSTEAQLLEQRRTSSTTKTKSRLSESTPAEESETVLSEEAVSSPSIAVPEFEVSATKSPPLERPPRQHRGSDIGEASPEEIRALERKLSIQEVDEESDEEEEDEEKIKATSTDEAEQEVTKGTEPQKTDAKDADQAGVSVGD
ncbi:hypothetical protein A1O3_06363 [Capronia epimyces CBS 606.96]|uniref:Glutaredoxin domain-containing protein n=1 Tax=Capronia epimyces CBS 606.96 TaxID=1182542 RepID=W9XYU8_9EURO|nr:uncharacterized protein A1O3_06363 [Capronia epimyces CBS 606.96]EXJ82550.1 hypothetical protein A1O3_06363 [Capronia epimyces CBS 606.96]